MNWLHYLLEANIYLAIFYAAYCLLLNNETHYTLNRVYLLLSCILSFTLPVIQVGWLKPAGEGAALAGLNYTVQLQPVAVSHIAAIRPVSAYHINWPEVLWCVYIIGIAVMTLLLVIKLFRVVNLTTSGKRMYDNKYQLIDIEDANTAFSFFNYLFIGTKLTGNDTIIRHELVHIRQKHSLDIIFMEVLKVINWFNPLIYLLQASIKTVHEYIADEQTAAQEGDAITYSSFLVNNAYGLNGSSVTHSFFNYNLLKKRIIMLNQQRSGKLARLKYLVAVPICAGMLCASTLAFSKNYAFIDLAPKAIANAAKLSVADTLTKRLVKTKATTSKGYDYEETAYLVNSKVDFRVIITEKNGNQKEYYKSKASGTETAMMKEKYGYSFPKMIIYNKLPPPPPMPPVAKAGTDKMPPPPPPAPPKHGAKNIHLAAPVVSMDMNKMPPPPPPAAPVPSIDINKTPPPPPPASPVVSRDINKTPPPPPPAPPIGSKRVKMLKLKPVPNVDIVIEAPNGPESATPVAAPTDVKPAASPINPKPAASTEIHKGDVTVEATDVSWQDINYQPGNKSNVPMVIANGKIMDIQSPGKNKWLNLHADKIIFYSATDDISMKKAVDKWGDKAKNGVFELAGNYSITTRSL